jgi:hypothetical protein
MKLSEQLRERHRAATAEALSLTEPDSYFPAGEAEAYRKSIQLAEVYEAEVEKRIAELEHACERSMSDFHTIKAYSEEIEGQLRKRVAELEQRLRTAKAGETRRGT